MNTLKRTIVIAAAVGVAAFSPAALTQPAAAAAPVVIAHSASVAPMSTVTVTVKCQLVNIGTGSVDGYVWGTGSGPNFTIALNNAKRDADSHVPLNHYKRHCYPVS